jgi:hypothetical protein
MPMRKRKKIQEVLREECMIIEVEREISELKEKLLRIKECL